jgi:glycosyltransferase involved in cell wall biosynthesis
VIYAGRGESADIIRREGCGVVVEPEQADALASAICEFADSPDVRNSMGERGRQLAEGQFSWRVLVADWWSQVNRIRAGETSSGARLDGERL